MADTIDIEILADGTIKSTTSKVSAPNHKAADEFFKYLATLTGGQTTRTKRKDAHAHSHAHEHEHEHN